ncbi:MAG: hypothetical protein K0R54_1865 [Clostridiaceae bacterium]|jgi:hypothetical protein|nr:hypothetical protein [Clostridiaceae bacterium]
MAIFYHISTELNHNGQFEPRIPEHRHKDAENIEIKRVCVAPSLEDCLTAIPNGGMRLESYDIDRRGYFLVITIDTDKLGISSQSIITSEELYEKDYVRDANITNEHWITCSFTVSQEDMFIIKLNGWQEQVYDVLPHCIYAIADEKYEGDYFEAYEEEYDKGVPCCTAIEDLDYTCENVNAGEEVNLRYYDDFEQEDILDLLKNYPVETMEVSIDGVLFKVKSSCNLKDLFLSHYNMLGFV